MTDCSCENGVFCFIVSLCTSNHHARTHAQTRMSESGAMAGRVSCLCALACAARPTAAPVGFLVERAYRNSDTLAKTGTTKQRLGAARNAHRVCRHGNTSAFTFVLSETHHQNG